MSQIAKVGTRRFDKYYGYWWVKVEEHRWKLEHHVVWESNGNEPCPRGYVVHHQDENKENNVYSNLVLLTRAEHARLHGRGKVHSEATRKRMREGAARRLEKPGHRQSLSERAAKQHKDGNLGRATWGPESDPGVEKWRELGKKQTERLRKMIRETPSAEMSRRSYCRKIFQKSE